ncbi:MAG: hypothetical protein FJ098_08000 [Deltaproteobacteria bacterium]|nr:hypothetical protein [Deltaproteobacteria bacterium]
MATPTVRTLAERPLHEALRGWIDNRIGNVLFLGARFPDLAAEMLERGISVMVVDPDVRRMEVFQAATRAVLGTNRRLGFDPRPYASIQFEASSYNFVLAWEGLPAGLDVSAFGKKLRRELKAGSNLYLRVPVRPAIPLGLAGRIPGPLARLRPAAEALERLAGRVLFPAGEALDLQALRTDLGRWLKIEEVVAGGPLLPRLTHLAPALADRTIPLPLAGVALERLDRRLRTERWTTEVLVRASKTLDMGRVFLTGSRFDPRLTGNG